MPIFHRWCSISMEHLSLSRAQSSAEWRVRLYYLFFLITNNHVQRLRVVCVYEFNWKLAPQHTDNDGFLYSIWHEQQIHVSTCHVGFKSFNEYFGLILLRRWHALSKRLQCKWIASVIFVPFAFAKCRNEIAGWNWPCRASVGIWANVIHWLTFCVLVCYFHWFWHFGINKTVAHKFANFLPTVVCALLVNQHKTPHNQNSFEN